MKTNMLIRIYALAMSTLFAVVTTLGIALMMTASGEQARTQFSASAAAPQSSQRATRELTHWQAPAADAKQVLLTSTVAGTSPRQRRIRRCAILAA